MVYNLWYSVHSSCRLNVDNPNCIEVRQTAKLELELCTGYRLFQFLSCWMCRSVGTEGNGASQPFQERWSSHSRRRELGSCHKWVLGVETQSSFYFSPDTHRLQVTRSPDGRGCSQPSLHSTHMDIHDWQPSKNNKAQIHFLCSHTKCHIPCQCLITCAHCIILICRKLQCEWDG